jgi:zinc/manganese transport system substrate-binding protein
MKTLSLLLIAATALPGPPETPKSPAATISVVATTPDLASIAREIGGMAVDVKALAKPTEDPHFVDAKPSHIVTLNRADALIEGGAELELGWLPPLLESARNSKIAAGAPGRIVATQGIKMMEIPATFDRS